MAAQLDSLRANAAMSNNVQLPSSIPFQSMPLFSHTQHQYAPTSHNAYQHQQSQSPSAPTQPSMVQPQQSTPKELMVQAPFKIPISLQAREPNQVPTPRNKSELELYHVLKQANLLDYYQTFIKLGGDDLEQLAEAEKNEEEFLEIVQLVGMSSKPLHVRRFQKAVRRWREDKSEPLDATSRPQAELYYDTGCNVSQDFSFRSDLTHFSSSAFDESVAPSTASRSLFPPGDHDYQSRYCTPPHQIIKNAPKRPRLMDSIMPSDLTKGIQLDESALEETPRRERFSNLGISPIVAQGPSALPSDRRRQRGTRFSPPDSPASQPSYSNSEISHSPLELDESQEKKPTTINKRKRLLKKPSPTNLEEFYNTKNPVRQVAKPSNLSDLAK